MAESSTGGQNGGPTAPTVFIVDDDPAVRESLSYLMTSVGINAEPFESAQAFLDGYDPTRPGCIVLDVRMSGMSGLDLQEKLQSMGCPLPVIMITGFGDVPMAVRALKQGALDFIEKPFTDQELLDRVNEGLDVARRNLSRESRREEVRARLERLTKRERQVMEMVVGGKPNKVIAGELGLSPKTVEVHRSRVMEKMETGSLADLLRMVFLHRKPADYSGDGGTT